MKPVILGMNSATGEALGFFPTNGAGRRLFEASGMKLRDYRDTFERMNLLEEPEWSLPSAKAAAAAIKEKLKGNQVIVLGSQAWVALSLPKKEPFDPHVASDATIWTLVPHPSGKNLWYNDPENRAAVARFFGGFRTGGKK